MFADNQGLCGTNVFDVHHVAGRSVQGRMGRALEILVLQALAPQARGDEAEALERLARAVLTQLLPRLTATFWTWTLSRPKRVCNNHARTLLDRSAYQSMARIARKGRRASTSLRRLRSVGETRG
jgi:hypothetical protein